MNNTSDQASAAPRVAVITGASSGIGLVTAKALASQGWRVIATGRDPERSARAHSQLRVAASGGVPVDFLRVDLSLMSEAATAADTIASLTDRVDVLINNAGGTAKEQVVTREGNEATFAGNHLGHFVLTHRLLPLLRRAAQGAPVGATRVISVSSRAHETAPGFDWSDPQMLRGFVPIKAYCNAKLANLYFTHMLSKQLWPDGIAVHAMHPGAVDSNFINHADPNTQQHLRSIQLVTSEDAADTVIWLALDAEPGKTTDGYFYQRRQIPTSSAAQDRQAAQRLWEESRKLTSAVLS
jgi:NAD(P)-dependent dehydrogenase (short-subunit alcohol dehydrogenase family)